MLNGSAKKERDAQLKQLRKSNVKMYKDAVAIVSRSAITRGEDPALVCFNGGPYEEWHFASKEIKTRLVNKQLLSLIDSRGDDDDPVHHQKVFTSTRLADCPFQLIDVQIVTEEERQAHLAEITNRFNEEVARVTDLLTRNVIDVPERNRRMLGAEDHQARLLDNYHLQVKREIFDGVQKRASVIRQLREKWLEKRQEAFETISNCLGSNVMRELSAVIATGCPVALWEALHWKYYTKTSATLNPVTSVNEWLATCKFDPTKDSWSAFKDDFSDYIERGRELGVAHSATSQLTLLIAALERGSNEFKDDIEYVKQSGGSFANMIQKVDARVQLLLLAAISVHRRHQESDLLLAQANAVKGSSRHLCWDCESPDHLRGDPKCPKRKKKGANVKHQQGRDNKSKDNKKKHKNDNGKKLYCTECRVIGHDWNHCFFNTRVYPDGSPFSKKRKHRSNGDSDTAEASQSSHGDRKSSIIGSEHWRGKSSGKAHTASSSCGDKQSSSKKARSVVFDDDEGNEHDVHVAIFIPDTEVKPRQFHLVDGNCPVPGVCCINGVTLSKPCYACKALIAHSTKLPTRTTADCDEKCEVSGGDDSMVSDVIDTPSIHLVEASHLGNTGAVEKSPVMYSTHNVSDVECHDDGFKSALKVDDRVIVGTGIKITVVIGAEDKSSTISKCLVNTSTSGSEPSDGDLSISDFCHWWFMAISASIDQEIDDQGTLFEGKAPAIVKSEHTHVCLMMSDCHDDDSSLEESFDSNEKNNLHIHVIHAFNIDPSLWKKEENVILQSSSFTQRDVNIMGKDGDDGMTVSFVVDSGASEHMCPYLKLFEFIDYSYRGKIIFGNGHEALVQGIGTLKNGLKNVLYVPKNLKVGLISVSSIDREGGVSIFQNGIGKCFDCYGNLIVMSRRIDRLYYTVPIDVNDHSMNYEMAMTSRQISVDEFRRLGVARSKKDSRWNRDLKPLDRIHKAGHIPHKAIVEGIKHGTIIGHGIPADKIPTLSDLKSIRICVSCIKGSAQPLPIYRHVLLDGESETSAPTEPLHYIFADDKGAFKVQSINGYRNAQIVTSRPARYMFVFGMKHKNEVVEKLADLRVEIGLLYAKYHSDNLNPAYFHVLYTDDESIYTSQAMKDFCKRFMIKHIVSAPYKHEMNGVIEHDIKVIFQKANTYMLEYDVPLQFWKECLDYCVYVYNRTPLESLDWKSPFQMVTNRVADLSFCHAFFSPGLMILNKDQRDKIGMQGLKVEHAKECRFLGVEDNAYVIWVPSEHKIRRHRDCLFEQNIFDHFTSSADRENFLRQYPTLFEASIEHEWPTLYDQPDFFDQEERNDTVVDNIDARSNRGDNGDIARDIVSSDSDCAVMKPFQQISSSTAVPPIIESVQPMVKDGVSGSKDGHTTVESMSDFIARLHSSDHDSSAALTSAVQVWMINKKEEFINDHTQLSDKSYYLNYSKMVANRDHIRSSAFVNRHAGKKIGLGYLPKNMEEACTTADSDKWIAAYDREISNLEASEVFRDLTPEEFSKIQSGAIRPIDTVLALALKYDANGEVVYKVRLTVRGFRQQYLVDYEETYSPTLNKSIMRALLFLCVAILKMKIRLVDFKQAFAQSDLDFVIYLLLPKFMWTSPTKKRYAALLRALYGLKQASLVWYTKLSKALMQQLGFERLMADACVFIRRNENGDIEIILSIHVDDMTISAKTDAEIDAFIVELKSVLPAVKEYPGFNHYLGIEFEIDYKNRRVYLSQQKYIEDQCVDKDGMFDLLSELSNSTKKRPTVVSTPMDSKVRYVQHAHEMEDIDHEWVKRLQIIHGIERYICDNTHPEISVPLGMVSHAVARPLEGHGKDVWNYHLNIMRYLRDARNICYEIGTQQIEFEMFAFCDASHITAHDSKGRLGYVIYFSHDSGAIKTKSVKETMVSHSAQESEVSAMDLCTRDVNVFRDFLRQIGFLLVKPTIVYVDSKSGKQACDTFKLNDMNRHYNNKLNYLREQVNARNVEFVFISCMYNVADLLTKNLEPCLFERFRDWLMRGIPTDIWILIQNSVQGRVHNAFFSEMDITIDWYEI